MGKVLELQVMVAKMRKCFNRVINDAVKNEVLTGMHGNYLVTLADNDLTKSEMTDILGFDKANTTRVIDELESFGYVVRKEGSKSNACLYHLTEKGKETALRIESALLDFIKQITNGISEENCKIYREVYLKILENIDNESKRKD